MNQQAPPKKMASRNVAIALGIVCMILAVGLVGMIANYALIISDRDNTIASLNSQVFQLNATATNLQSQIDYLNSRITSLQNQVDNLTQTLTTAQGVADGLQLTMKLEKWEYNLGEPINITLTVTNISNQTVDYVFQSPEFDFRVHNDTNNNLYEWIHTQAFLNYELPASLNAGESISSGNIVWPQTYSDSAFSEGFPVSAGAYFIVGYFFTSPFIQTNPIQVTITSQ